MTLRGIQPEAHWSGSLGRGAGEFPCENPSASSSKLQIPGGLRAAEKHPRFRARVFSCATGLRLSDSKLSLHGTAFTWLPADHRDLRKVDV